MNEPALTLRENPHSFHAVARPPVLRFILATLLLVACSGCMNAQNTRFPSWFAYFPGAENAAYQQQDPFPDPDIGPSLDSSPRGYERPRSEQRRAAEQRLFQGVPVGPENVPPGVPQGGLSRSRAVY